MAARVFPLTDEHINAAADACDELSGRYLGRMDHPIERTDVQKARNLIRLADDLRFASSNSSEPDRKRWEAVDWSKTDSTLASVMGITREAVRQGRKRVNAPEPVMKHRSKAERVRAYIDSHQMLPTAREIAKELGVSSPLVYSVAREAGRKLTHSNTKYQWELINWENQANREVAEALGITGPGTLAMVSNRRRKYAPHTLHTTRSTRTKKE